MKRARAIIENGLIIGKKEKPQSFSLGWSFELMEQLILTDKENLNNELSTFLLNLSVDLTKEIKEKVENTSESQIDLDLEEYGIANAANFIIHIEVQHLQNPKKILSDKYKTTLELKNLVANVALEKLSEDISSFWNTTDRLSLVLQHIDNYLKNENYYKAELMSP